MDRLKRIPIDTRECYKLKYNIQIIYTHNLTQTTHKISAKKISVRRTYQKDVRARAYILFTKKTRKYIYIYIKK